MSQMYMSNSGQARRPEVMPQACGTEPANGCTAPTCGTAACSKTAIPANPGKPTKPTKPTVDPVNVEVGITEPPPLCSAAAVRRLLTGPAGVALGVVAAGGVLSLLYYLLLYLPVTCSSIAACDKAFSKTYTCVTPLCGTEVFNASRVMKLVESDPTGLGAFDTIEWPFDDGINGTIPDVYEYAYYECHEDTTSTMSFFEATKEASLKCMQARLGESDALDVHATLALSHELSALACASPSRCGDAKCDCVTAAEFAEAEPAAGTVVASMVCEYATENITCITTTIDNAANALVCPPDAIDLTHNCSSVPEDEVFALSTNLSVCVNLTKSGGFLLVPEVESIACPPNSTLGSLDWVA